MNSCRTLYELYEGINFIREQWWPMTHYSDHTHEWMNTRSSSVGELWALTYCTMDVWWLADRSMQDIFCLRTDDEAADASHNSNDKTNSQ